MGLYYHCISVIFYLFMFAAGEDANYGACGYLLMALSIFIIIITFPIAICLCVKVLVTNKKLTLLQLHYITIHYIDLIFLECFP